MGAGKKQSLVCPLFLSKPHKLECRKKYFTFFLSSLCSFDTMTANQMEDGYEFRNDYSGRCMYGQSCIGIVSDDNGFEIAMKLCRYLTDMGEEDMMDVFDATVNEDSMGLSRIIYFPRIQVEETEEV